MSKLIDIVLDQTTPFKTLFEGLKEILAEVNIEIIRPDKESKNGDDSDKGTKKETGGIKIFEIDTRKTLLLNVKLDASQFSKFECKKEVTLLGINLGNFYKLIKSLLKDDTLNIIVNDDDKHNLILKVTNLEAGKEVFNKLKLIEINKVEMEIPSVLFDVVIVFKTSEFHSICKDMDSMYDYIEFKCTKKSMTFSCKGDSTEKSCVYYANENGLKITLAENSPEIVQGIFELERLIIFSKYQTISTDIQIFMKNNYPVCIKYTIATLGNMFFCLNPINPQNITNYSDEDDDYEEDDKIKYKTQNNDEE